MPELSTLSPSAQARYHLGCAWRHVLKAGSATCDIQSSFLTLLLIVIGIAAIVTLSGCVTSGNGVRWSPLVPTTWPIFSGESKVNAAERAEARRAKQADKVATLKDESVHAAHIEFLKGWSVLGMMPVSLNRDLAWRFTSNGLFLLDQADPLTAQERASAQTVVQDFTSEDPARVAAAEEAQRKAEVANDELSKRLAAAETKATKLGTLARKANAQLADVAAENIGLANQVRIFRWAIGALIVLLVFAGAAAIYARLALGGVGAALHTAGAPAAVVQALDGELSKLGQWMIRTGRVAAAKIAAKAALQ